MKASYQSIPNPGLITDVSTSSEPAVPETLEMDEASQIRPAAPPSAAYRYYVLGILVLVYTLNFLDRQILGILAAPIKAELHLSDSQLGLMGGLAFAILYSTMGVPVAWLADRSSRAWIMTAALSMSSFESTPWPLAADARSSPLRSQPPKTRSL